MGRPSGGHRINSKRPFEFIRYNPNPTLSIFPVNDILLIRRSSSTRLKLLYLLDNMKELCVCDLAEMLGVSVSAVSQHLAVLRDAGLVAVRREGNRRYYQADKDRLGPLRQVLEEMWSGSLDRLAPEWLAEVPLDPFVDKAFRYKQMADGYRLYSVGENMTDDGGASTTSRISFIPRRRTCLRESSTFVPAAMAISTGSSRAMGCSWPRPSARLLPASIRTVTS